MLQINLKRFRVIKGQEKLVDEWLSFLNDNMDDTILTLQDENMYVETIHREKIGDYEYLYWFLIQGDGGKSVYESESYIDKKHLEYWNLCIDKTYTNHDIPTKVIMIPNEIRQAMK